MSCPQDLCETESSSKLTAPHVRYDWKILEDWDSWGFKCFTHNKGVFTGKACPATIMVRYVRNQGMMMGRTVWMLVIGRSDNCHGGVGDFFKWGSRYLKGKINRLCNTLNQPWHVRFHLETYPFFGQDFAKHHANSVKSLNMGILWRQTNQYTTMNSKWFKSWSFPPLFLQFLGPPCQSCRNICRFIPI